MPMNTMSFEQVSTVLNTIVSQASGKTTLTPTDTSSFIAVAKVGLETGYDPLMTAISQVLTRTIFSVRPYNRKFGGLYNDSQRWGNHVRKLQVVDKQFEDYEAYNLVDGQSVDMFKVKKPEVLQTNFYGESAYADHLTIYKDQLDVAFTGPDEFARFISMIMQNMSDRIEKSHEELARAAVANFIGGKILGDSANVIHLLDLYDAETGLTSDAQTIKQPANFAPFAKWLFSFIKTTSSLMTERSVKYHQNFTIGGVAKPIMRHTPVEYQKLYLYAKELNDIDASVLSGVFQDRYMQLMDHEMVNYWQAIDSPMAINLDDAGYTSSAGAATSGAVTEDNVLGILFDREAIGYTTINEFSGTTPFNPIGKYSNLAWSFLDRYYNDLTENAVVLLLDHSA